MKLTKPYDSLEDTLLMLKKQVRDSVPFAAKVLPAGRMTPEAIFRWLKSRVIYCNDPDGVELLQSMPTLLSYNNRHGVPGCGDCDCFTISALACLIAKGYGDSVGIYLVGRSKQAPVHIYAAIFHKPFDLTNNNLGQERGYPYKQYLDFRL